MFPTPSELQTELMRSLAGGEVKALDERGKFTEGDGVTKFFPTGPEGQSLFVSSHVEEGMVGSDFSHYGFFSCTDPSCDHIVASGDDISETERVVSESSTVSLGRFPNLILIALVYT